MTAPLDLFTAPPALGTNPETVEFAAEFVERQRRIVYAFIVSQGRWGATMREAEHALLISRQSLCWRFRELCGGKRINGFPEYRVYVVRTEERRERCQVYRAVAA